MPDRFDYADNLARAGSYRAYRSPFWPPADGYRISCLDLGPAVPDLGGEFRSGLAALKSAIEAEWQDVKQVGVRTRRRLNNPAPVARAMRQVGEHLPGEADRRAIALRAGAAENGYDNDALEELAKLEEDITVVAGQISTWFGKEVKGLPTAFACRRDEAQLAHVTRALGHLDDAAGYLRRLHVQLRLGEVPAFGAAELFFMAGEGNLHPKHIAYFLPEDEGVKYSTFKKTYYFANTHRAILKAASAPLAARFLRAGATLDPADPRWHAIPTLGVLSHEFGHFVHRESTSFKDINTADRWASVVLQETMADVYGILLLADVWAEPLGIDPHDVVAYYLAECLRYVDRGLGHFPDSDGMFLQLSYFVELGALGWDSGDGGRLVGEPGRVLAGLRSLARVLADALLDGRAEPAVALYRRFGPAAPARPLDPLLEALRRHWFTSIEYVQEQLYGEATA